jgi:two-component system response regulator HydG
MPPLRERVEDIPVLAAHFVQRYAARNGKGVAGVSRAAMDRLVDFRWPGNIRELEHAIERAVVLSTGRTIEVEHLPDAVRGAARTADGGAAPGPTITVPIGTRLEEVERRLIEETLRTTGGNKQRAAEMLGIAARTIYRKLG